MNIRKNLNTKRKNRSNQRRASFNRGNVFDSSKTVKPRGNAFQVLEKYLVLAQDANSNGDKIKAEGYYQYAEHYQRLINQNQGSERKKNDNNISNMEEKPADERPSRTERADLAKQERVKNQEDAVQKDNLNTKEKKTDDFTSDGIEALKPFEFSVNEKKN